VKVSAVATEGLRNPGSTEPQTGSSAQRLFEPGGQTLEDAVLDAWEELVADGRAECPICGGAMSMLAGCEGCGSELS
jgi:hypothetical protein